MNLVETKNTDVMKTLRARARERNKIQQCCYSLIVIRSGTIPVVGINMCKLRVVCELITFYYERLVLLVL